MNKLKIRILLSYICIASISAAIITPALPQIQTTYALTQAALGWLISIFLVGYVVGQLIYGPLANRYGRLKALRSGLLANLLGILLCIMAASSLNYHLLLFGRLVTALGAASGLSCTFILLNELLNREQLKHAMSFATLSFTLGSGLAVTIGGLITAYWHWQACFWILFIHGVIMLGLTWQFPETLKERLSLHPSTILSRYGAALKSKALIIFSLNVGLLTAITYCFSTAAPLYSESILSLTPDAYGYWNLMNVLGMLFSSFLAAYLMKHYRPERVLLLGFSALVPCLISLIFISIAHVSSTLWFFTTSMFTFLFAGLLFPAASYFASNTLNDKASASSMMSFINMGSGTLAVLVMSYLPLNLLSSFTVTTVVFFLLALSLTLKYFIQNSALTKTQ